MSRKAADIKTALADLATKPYEVISGTVAAGSVDATAQTVTVTLPDGTALPHVRLKATTGSSDGCTYYPKDGSTVVIGGIDGPGQWVVLAAAAIDRAVVTIGEVSVNITDTEVNIANNGVVVRVGSAALKLATASESLYQVLKDLLTYLQVLTVPTSTGPSGVPTNVGDFLALQARLDNILEP
jgi:hypothetical protein